MLALQVDGLRASFGTVAPTAAIFPFSISTWPGEMSRGNGVGRLRREEELWTSF